jgi:hypothetical protein
MKYQNSSNIFIPIEEWFRYSISVHEFFCMPSNLLIDFLREQK